MCAHDRIESVGSRDWCSDCGEHLDVVLPTGRIIVYGVIGLIAAWALLFGAFTLDAFTS